MTAGSLLLQALCVNITLWKKITYNIRITVSGQQTNINIPYYFIMLHSRQNFALRDSHWLDLLGLA